MNEGNHCQWDENYIWLCGFVIYNNISVQPAAVVVVV